MKKIVHGSVCLMGLFLFIWLMAGCATQPVSDQSSMQPQLSSVQSTITESPLPVPSPDIPTQITATVNAYVKAIKEKDIGYLYAYLVMIHEDAEKPYNDPEHNTEYVRIATEVLTRYEKEMNLQSITCEQQKTLDKSDMDPTIIKIQYQIRGKANDGTLVRHEILGIYENPIIGVKDSWFGD